MKKLRKNAGLAAVAANARARTKAAKKTWEGWQETKRTKILSFEEQCRAEAAWSHYKDLAEITEHLERLVGGAA